MSNLSILEQNILLAIEGAADEDAARVDEAQAIFLRCKDRDVLKAECTAYEWAEHLQPFLGELVALAAGFHAENPHAVYTSEETSKQVMDFIKERHMRRYFPGH